MSAVAFGEGGYTRTRVSAPGLLLVFTAALLAGAVNSIAGGGTLLTFPALVWLGLPPISANATSTVALWPGSFGSMWAYRGQLKGTRRWLLLFTIPSVAGGIVGAQLLLHTSAARFDAIVPFLVLGATVLFMLQQPLSRRLARRAADEHAVAAALPPPSAWLLAGQFGVAVYGGYFGAGIGILMLAALGAMGLGDIHRMNGIKNWGAMCINAIAADDVRGERHRHVAGCRDDGRRGIWLAATAAHAWRCASARNGSGARSSRSGCWRSCGCW